MIRIFFIVSIFIGCITLAKQTGAAKQNVYHGSSCGTQFQNSFPQQPSLPVPLHRTHRKIKPKSTEPTFHEFSLCQDHESFRAADAMNDGKHAVTHSVQICLRAERTKNTLYLFALQSSNIFHDRKEPGVTFLESFMEGGMLKNISPFVFL